MIGELVLELGGSGGDGEWGCAIRGTEWNVTNLVPRLEGLPEIDRESILATRQEEIQKYKESLQIAAMYKMAVDQDDDDDDSHPRKRQSECSAGWVRPSRS